jgi:hypothetical protein
MASTSAVAVYRPPLMDKLDGLYPMPGGVTRYFETALEILAAVGPEGGALSDIRAWMLERFKVDGAVAVPGYFKLLAALGWVVELDDRLGLTPRGAALLQTRDPATAFADLDARFSGMSETLGLLREGSRPRREMLAELNQALGKAWKSHNQVNFRVNWLRSLGMAPSSDGATVDATADAARAALERVHDDPDVRAQCFALLADAVERAHHHGDARWVVSLRDRRMVSLSVGFVLVCRLKPGFVRVAFDEAGLDESARQYLASTNALDLETFATAPGVKLMSLPADEIGTWRPLLDAALLRAIDRGAGTVSARTPFFRAHSDDVLDALELVTGRLLPRPEYGPEEATSLPARVDPAALAEAFERFRADAGERLRVDVRRARARLFAELCADPSAVTLETFDRDWWPFEHHSTLRAEDITGQWLTGSEPVPPEVAADLSRALEAGQLELHGNYCWGVASRIFAPMIGDPDERLASARAALTALGDPSATPLAKMRAVDACKGFGETVASGFTMLRHPESFTIVNEVSRGALASLGFAAGAAVAVQESAAVLRAQLGAEDALEADWFLYLLANGRYGTVAPAVPVDVASGAAGRRYLKVAPGREGSLWEQCIAEGRICVGWDELGDFRAFPTRAAFIEAFEKQYTDTYKGWRPAIMQFANELWSLFQLRPGDVVVANLGRRQVLGVGVVQAPGYEWAPERAGYRQTVRVQWDTSQAKAVPEQKSWFRTMVPLTEAQFRALGLHVGPSVVLPTDGDEEEDEVYIEGPSSPRPVRYVEPSLGDIQESLRSEGLRLDPRTIRRYHLALRSRGFVILAGISGTGKTWLAEAYARAVGAKVLVVPVAPSWTTNEDLLGYLNPMNGKYYDTAFSTFLRAASAAYAQATDAVVTAQPFHVVLDEMNLARVEHYFARFLSAMELRHRLTIAPLELSPGDEVPLPPNLLFVGTVNVDETTHGFADKVYDRAQLIEMPAPRTLIAARLEDEVCGPMLLRVWDAVEPVAPFAFRAIDDVVRYVRESVAIGVAWSEALDEQILQKVLPRLKGTDPRLAAALDAVAVLDPARLPLSAERAVRMREDFGRHGFASFF